MSRIFYEINNFEKLHPELEILHWHIESTQPAHGHIAAIHGIWVQHKLKEIKQIET